MQTPPPSPGWEAGRAAAWAGMPVLPGGPLALAQLADIVLLVGMTVAMVGIVAWFLHLRAKREIERRTGVRTRKMTELIEHAHCVLWEAEVDLAPNEWTWRMQLHPSAFCRQLFQGKDPQPDRDLWQDYQIDNREEMNRRAREAMEGGRPGYEQEFRAIREGRTFWLHENVSITKLDRDRFWLVGLVTDLTAQREAEAARRQSELTVERILAHAQCMIWRATVIEENGALQWPHFDLPQSQLSEELFGSHRAYSPQRGFWESLEMPELAEMNERCRQAVLGGAPDYVQQFRAITPAGRTFWLHERVSITQVGERLWSLVGVATDITAQRAAEEAQQRSETRLAHLLARADSMIWQARVDRVKGGELSWTMFIPPSQLHRRIFGREPSGNRGFDWKENGVPEHEKMVQRAFRAIEQGAPGYDQIFHVPRPAGAIWLSETVTINPTGPGSWDLVGIITDITARHQAEEASRASQERLHKLLALADCLLWEAKVELTPAEVIWDIACHRTGLTRQIFGDAPPPTSVGLWYRFQVPERAEMDRRAREALEAGAPGYEQQFRLIRPDRTFWLNESVTITRTGPNRFWLVGLATDITVQRETEEARQASELRLATLLERSNCMIWQGECRRRGPDDFSWSAYTPRSQLFRRLFGRDPEGACQFGWSSDSVPEFQEMRQRARQAMSSGRAGYEQEFHYLHPDGDIWLNEKVTIKSVGPDHWELLGIITDITARRESERALQVSEQRLGELLSRADCLVWESTVELLPEGWKWARKIQPSMFYRRLTGAPLPPDTLAMWPPDRVPERGEMDRRCRAAIEGGLAGYDQVFRFVRQDGSTAWVGENVTIQRLDEKRYWLVGVAVDLTAQRGAEEALVAEKERLAVTLRAMHESVITTDIAGRIEFMNPAAARLTEWSIEECKGRLVHEVCVLESARSGQAVAVPVARVAHGDVLADLPAQTRLVSRLGKRRQVEGCCAPIHGKDSQVTGSVIVIRDVTEQERLEQELVRATRLESVGVLAGGIAHDFNNILTAVMGNLALAQMDIPADSPAGASVRSAERAALRARDLTQQLLTFAKGGDPVRAAVQLETVVREMATFALHGSRVKAHYDLAPDLWPADADKGQIGRVVQNLVINAVQSMPAGGTLQIAARNDPHAGFNQPGLAPGDYIQMTITDTGEGIKPENLARIFDPYFTTKQTGTGLGLAAVYSMIKKHRGHIEVESQVGQGTTFRFWLPALSGEVATSGSKRPWAGGETRPMKGRVLFMDDEQIIRDMAVSLLTRFGLTVDCAVDGAETVEKYRAELAAGRRYDLVITDLTVPGGMGGLAALEKLRELDPAVKVVVSSGYSSDPVLANHRSHGFAGMVAKPYDVDEISRVLREVLPRV